MGLSGLEVLEFNPARRALEDYPLTLLTGGRNEIPPFVLGASDQIVDIDEVDMGAFLNNRIPDGLLSRIRSSCAEVAEKAEYVTIQRDLIRAYAATLPVEKILTMALSPEEHYLGQGEGTLNFLLVLHSINFGSGYSPAYGKRKGLGFYNSVASALKEFYVEFGPPSAETLAKFSEERCFELFGQDRANLSMVELMGLFARALVDLGRYTLERYRGSFPLLIADAKNSAERLVSILAQMPFFYDVHTFKGREVAFMKRAQIAASDLAVTFGNDGYGRFDDVNELTMFADNGIPQILVHEGLISYAPALQKRIFQGELLPSGSQEEVEIRACALHTVELLSEALKGRGTPAPSRLIDFYLWMRRQEPDFRAAVAPSHKTRCVFY